MEGYTICTAILSCCDVYGNEGGDWTGLIAGQLGLYGNISLDPLICNASQQDFHLQEGSPCAPASPPHPQCGLVGAWEVGCNPSGIDDPAQPVVDWRLDSGAPNPFSASTLIRLTIPAGGEETPVHVRVFDTAGRLVRTLQDGPVGAGSAQIFWDGTDEDGAPLPGGVYFCRLEAGGKRVVRRIVLMK